MEFSLLREALSLLSSFALVLSVFFGFSISAQESSMGLVEEINYNRNSMEDIFADEQDGKISGKRLSLTGRFGISAASYATRDSDSTGTILRFVGGGKYRITENLNLNSELKLSFLTDRTQETYGDASIENGLRLKHASLDYKPTSNFQFSAGALRQGYVAPTNLLIDSDATFPATMQWVRIGNSTLAAELSAEQAIPTSRSFDVERQEKEDMPNFFMEKLSLDYVPNEHFQIKPHVGLFQFNELPSKVAFFSGQKGNSIIPGDEATARFQHGFKGYFFGGEVLFRLNDKWNVVGFYNEVRNSDAPNASNTGREVGLVVPMSFRNYDVIPKFTSRFNESDTSPAYYNSVEWDGNNVEGYTALIKVRFHRYKFDVSLEYHSNEIINPNNTQKDSELLFVSLETFDVNF